MFPKNKTTTQNTKIALHIFVYGKVQGVGFRYWTAGLAKSLNITGWVRNTEKYNCVEIFAEMSPTVTEEFLSVLKNEHPYARVETITKNKMHLQNYKRFSIVT